MPTGLQVYGSHGVFQIDGTYKNLFLRAKHSVVTTAALGTTGATAGSSKTDLISISGIANPVIAVRAANNITAMLWWQSSTQMQVVLTAAVGTAVTIYVFGDPVASAPGSNYLQVFNDAGTLLFDAGQKPMRVADMQVVTTQDGYNASLPSGRTYAAASFGGYFSDYVSAGPGQWYYYMVRPGVRFTSATTAVSGGVALVGELRALSGTSVPFSNALMMVLDVTDY